MKNLHADNFTIIKLEIISKGVAFQINYYDPLKGSYESSLKTGRLKAQLCKIN